VADRSKERMIRIFATDKKGDRFEIKDLYWFEEKGVHDFTGACPNGNYTLELFVNDVLVYTSPVIPKDELEIE
jgi:hypothetical protein